jgi:hypothetical protein
MKRINLNTVLLFLGAIAVFAPDVASVAAWLAGAGIEWLAPVARMLGALALLLSSLPRIITRLRPVLSMLNLASPAGQSHLDAQDEQESAPLTSNGRAASAVVVSVEGKETSK